MNAIRLISRILKVAAAVLAGVYELSFAYSFLVLVLNALFPGAAWWPSKSSTAASSSCFRLPR